MSEKVSLPYKEAVLYCHHFSPLNHYKMNILKEISTKPAWEMLNNRKAVLVDIRNLSHFNYNYPRATFRLTNQSFSEFQQKYDYQQVDYYKLLSWHN